VSKCRVSAGRCGRIDGSRGAIRARQQEVARGDPRRRRPAGSVHRGRDPEDSSSVHLSGGTPGRAGPPHSPTSVRIPPPGAAYARGAPSAEEATPCISRLRPPPPTTVSTQAGPRCLPGWAPTCRHTRTMPACASRSSQSTPHSPFHPPARTGLRLYAPTRTGTRLHLRTDPGPQPGRPIRTDHLAGRPTRPSPPFAPTPRSLGRSSRPS
jgi:hypothetical protein